MIRGTAHRVRGSGLSQIPGTCVRDNREVGPGGLGLLRLPCDSGLFNFFNNYLKSGVKKTHFKVNLIFQAPNFPLKARFLNAELGGKPFS